jgi:hypothetical protein
MKRAVEVLAIALLTLGPATRSMAQDAGAPTEVPAPPPTERPYSPYVEAYAGDAVPTRVYWGDTHLHTSFSMDAGAFGARLGPEDAYRFARGEEVRSSTGQRVRLARPLDFLVVADHSDNMGFFPDLFAGDPEILANPTGRRWYDLVQAGGESGVQAAIEIIDMFSRGEFPEALMYWPQTKAYKSAWAKTIAAAESYNDPSQFTAFIGYEWTSQVPPGNNLHRVVIYRDGKDKASQTVPATTYPPHGSTNPEDKEPLTREYAQTRARWEPLYEVTQIKGDGETHPLLSPNDEFADFGTWDKGNLNLSEAKTDDMLQHEYARSALKLGLELEQQLGTNPYKFGMIGSTDSHTALSTADDDNFFGKHSGSEPSPDRMEHPFIQSGDLAVYGWETLASGYAAVWARENTREALFDAMERKEVYATTGPRMVVRFFGGWDFVPGDANTRQPAVAGYQKGVPMGGDLSGAPPGRAPTFLVAALKDPLGGNLDRIQIVKGWLDASGELGERVYDVAVSDGRAIGPDGRCTTPVGNTVDVANATWTNTIGATELISVWTDPDFDPAQRAFYYARVIAIPTPRWTAYDAKYYGLELPAEVPATAQERAYTSPIWYAPGQ